jgi:hypothetical protein
MNFYEIRREFDRMCRTAGLDTFDSYRDNWINMGWSRISELFVVPSLKKKVTMDSVADQQYYFFPADYNGTEIGLKYDKRRLDPVQEESSILKHERRTGNLGIVRTYDWAGCLEEDLLVIHNCTLTNGSPTVQTTSTNSFLNEDYWVRFDPYEDVDNTDKEDDVNNIVDPGDYGYQILAGNQISGTSFQLSKKYRGPSGSGFTVRVRPAEQQRFVTYGIPATSITDGFELVYSARPRRLFNNSDVPEWPNLGPAIAYMAINLSLEWHHNIELANSFFGRAMQRIEGLKKRKARSQALISDMTIGSTVGRHTGNRGVWMRGRFR